VVAQKAATMQILSGGRFRLGLGAGENLNEHVVGKRWPAVGERHEMFSEAVDVISQLFEGGDQSHRGKHFQVESARLWDLPDTRVPIGIAVSGAESCALAGRKADIMIATVPEEVGEQLPCGADVEEHVEKVRPFIDAGFTEIALVQIGEEHQDAFTG
jgi:G6PDH family F420-dependent oxidoreductase